MKHEYATYPPLGVLKPVADDVWLMDGPVISFYGLPFPTRMTIVRLEGGDIWVHSPTSDDESWMDAVEELGPVRHLVAPNWIHYAWVPAWQARFPDATSWFAPGVVARAESRGMTLGDFEELAGADPWAPEIKTRIVEGHPTHREAVFFHEPTRTLILTDLIENFEREKLPWWARPLAQAAGILDPDGKAPLDMRLSFRRGEREATRESIRELIGWKPERVILAHGRWYQTDGEAELRRAFRWLGPL